MTPEEEQEVRDAIRGWIAKKSGGKVEARAIADDTPLIAEKILKSLQLMELILWLERFTDDPIDVEMLKPGAFGSIDAIMATFFPSGG